MRGVGRGLLLMVAIAIHACGPSEPEPDPLPGGEPSVTLFAPGVVSSELPEFAVSFTPSGDTVFFNRTPPDRSRIDLLLSVRTDEGWSEPSSFTPLEDVTAIDPFVSVDGSYLYFSSDLPREGGLAGAFNLWRLPLGDSGASPEPLPAPINTDSSEVFNSISSDGVMVFSSRRDGMRHVYEASWDGATFGAPTRLVLGDGTSASNPALHPSGRYLVFARAAPGGPTDLYLSCRDGTEWSRPVLLPEPVNSAFTEFAPGFDAEHLYFTSERPGIVGPVSVGERPPGDVYRVRMDDLEPSCEAMSM